MVDKLHSYQGTVGQLHTIRDNVKSNFENWKENRSNFDTKRIVDKVLRKEPAETEDKREQFAFAHLYR